MFVLSAVLLIPKVGVKPDLEEVQEVLNLAGKNITAVSKGVGQWAANQEVSYFFRQIKVLNDVFISIRISQHRRTVVTV